MELKFTFHVYHHDDHGEHFARFGRLLSNISVGVGKMADELSIMEGKVTRLENLATGIGKQLSEIALALNNAMSANDPVRLAAVSRRLDSLTGSLLAAGNATDITPETPLEPPPVVEPPVDLPPGETPV